MKKFLVAILLMTSVTSKGQFLLFLDKGDIFKSPETDIVVMDKFYFSKLYYASEKYDTLKREIWRYDSLLRQKDSTEKEIKKDYENIISSKDAQIKVFTEGYSDLKGFLQTSIEQQNQLRLDYLKLEQKNRRTKRWRNFFMGATALFGAIIYVVVR